MSLEEFERFLSNQGGVTTKAIIELRERSGEKINPVFFQPYSSKADPMWRAVSIATAPIALFISALELVVYTVAYAFNSIANALNEDTKKAYSEIQQSFEHLCLLGIALLGVVLSPVINALDLIGSGVATLLDDDSVSEIGLP